MSSRALRKALDAQNSLELEDHSDSEDDVTPTQRKPGNIFAMLGDDDENSADQDEQSTESEAEEKEEKSLPLPNARKFERSHSRKRKPKTKGERKQNREAGNSSEESDDLDSQLAQLSETAVSDSPRDFVMTSGEAESEAHPSSLLGAQKKFLDADNEVRKLTGMAMKKGAGPKEQRRPRGMHSSKKYWLVEPRPNWPLRENLGIVMEKIDAGPGNELHFTFRHTKKYQEIQRQFFTAVDRMDHEAIANLLYIYPYHVDSLLQLAEVCAIQGDVLQATELVEKALYTLESSFHHLFKLSTGLCRLSYSRYENRALFLALFRYCMMLQSRGCWRTALEYSKALLSLDSSDPLGAQLLIDLCALQCKETAFLIELHDTWNPIRHLRLLPNFAYSVALAYFFQEQKAVAPETGIVDGGTQKSSELLQQAMMLFPMAVVPLAEKGDIPLDRSIADNVFFRPLKAVPNMSAYHSSVLGLVNLYAYRSFMPWTASGVAVWFNINAAAVAQKVANQHEDVKRYENERIAAYGTHGSSMAVQRHILISGVNEALAALPQAVKTTAVLSYDPLPPNDSVTPYLPREETRLASVEPGVLLFLRSMFPSFNIEDGQQGGEEGQNAEGGLERLLDALGNARASIVQALQQWRDAADENGQPGNNPE